MGVDDCVDAALQGVGLTHHFQPIWDLRNGSLLGFEALARFRDGTPPDAVWQAAQARGLAVALDQVSAHLALRLGQVLPGLLFVNLSAGTVAAAGGPARARIVALLAAGRRTQRVAFEVTEDALPAPRDVAAGLDVIRRVGVPLVLDDAGAGAATAERLELLSPTLGFVKLDRSVVQTWLRQGIGALPLWVAWSQQVRAPCVAEGVEDPEAAWPLLRAGVPYAQGFAFGAPAPAEAWTAAQLERVRPQPLVVYVG
jgi:EAL domain-containing protein (putative c-di-GMP-specific phosphodiesterase class I)